MRRHLALPKFALVVGLFLAAGPARGFKRTNVGEPIKDFTLQTLDGETLNLRERLGEKATVVVFWATWSPRSAEALADFQKLYEAYRDRGLQVIGVNVEHQEWEPGAEAEVERFVREHGIGFPVVIDRDLAVFNAYGVIAVPSLLLADAQGEIRELLEGYAHTTRDDFRDRVLELLGVLERRPAPAPEAAGFRPKGKAERYTRMGEILLKREVPHRAVLAFRKAVREDPEYLRAYEGLARAYELLGREQEAAEARARARELREGAADRAPGSGGRDQDVSGPGPAARRYYRMGTLFMDRRLYRAAEASFRRALEAAPGWREAVQALATALEAQGRTKEARELSAAGAGEPGPEPQPPSEGASGDSRSGEPAEKAAPIGSGGSPVPAARAR